MLPSGFRFFDTRETGIMRITDLQTILHSLGTGLTHIQATAKDF
jgi:hypothetical protein